MVELFVLKSTKKYLNRRFTNVRKHCIMVISQVGEKHESEKVWFVDSKVA